MAEFKFKLQAVLNQRRNVEDGVQRELAKLLRENMVLESQLRGMQQSLSMDKRTMANVLVGMVDVGRIRQHGAHHTQATIRAQQIAVRMLGLQRRIDAVRQRLIDATKQRKAMELLRNNRLAAWRIEENRSEAREIDEISTQRHNRQVIGHRAMGA